MPLASIGCFPTFTFNLLFKVAIPGTLYPLAIQTQNAHSHHMQAGLSQNQVFPNGNMFGCLESMVP